MYSYHFLVSFIIAVTCSQMILASPVIYLNIGGNINTGGNIITGGNIGINFDGNRRHSTEISNIIAGNGVLKSQERKPQMILAGPNSYFINHKGKTIIINGGGTGWPKSSGQADRMVGNGIVKSEDRNVGNFDGVQVRISAEVFLSQGPDTSVRVEGDSNILPCVETVVQTNRLSIGSHTGSFSPKLPIKVYIQTPSITNIEAAGSSTVTAETSIESSMMNISVSDSGGVTLPMWCNIQETYIELSGSGSVELAGKTRLLDAHIVGSGSLKALNMDAAEVKVSVTGSGEASVSASSRISATQTGSGQIRYKGQAAIVKMQRTGSGSITRI